MNVKAKRRIVPAITTTAAVVAILFPGVLFEILPYLYYGIYQKGPLVGIVIIVLAAASVTALARRLAEDLGWIDIEDDDRFIDWRTEPVEPLPVEIIRRRERPRLHPDNETHFRRSPLVSRYRRRPKRHRFYS